jgi:hypothetical protein
MSSQDATQQSHEGDSQPTSRESTPGMDVESQTSMEDDEEDENQDDMDEDDDEEEDDRFPYSVAEIVAIFTEFYQSLAKLHHNPARLKFPPPAGWPQLAPEHVGHWKDSFALDILRHLPYFESGDYVSVDFECCLVDYTTKKPDFFAKEDWREPLMTDFWRDGSPIQPRMCFLIADGRADGEGPCREWVFDAVHGEVQASTLYWGDDTVQDVKEFLDETVEKYKKMHIISLAGRSTLLYTAKSLDKEGVEFWQVAEATRRVSEEEVMAQKPPDWNRPTRFGTELDIQFLRQVFRDHGWPDAFRRQECKAYIDELMERMEKIRGLAWAVDDHLPPGCSL